MEYSQKMYLVDKCQLDGLSSQNREEPDIQKSATRRFDSEMQEVLRRQDLLDYDKVTLYSSILQKYLTHFRQAENEKNKLTLYMPPEETASRAVTNP